MSRLMRISTMLAGLTFGGLLCCTQARADLFDQTTKLTFSAPVEVPGVVLLPGTYEFRLIDVESDLDHVEILDADGMHVITTVMTIPVSRVEPTKTVVTFEQRAPRAPKAIKDWFYPGETEGHEFLYPKVNAKYRNGAGTGR